MNASCLDCFETLASVENARVRRIDVLSDAIRDFNLKFNIDHRFNLNFNIARLVPAAALSRVIGQRRRTTRGTTVARPDRYHGFPLP